MERVYKSEHDATSKVNTPVTKKIEPINNQTPIKSYFSQNMPKDSGQTQSNNLTQVQTKYPNVIQMWRNPPEPPGAQNINVDSLLQAEPRRAHMMQGNAVEVFVNLNGGPIGGAGGANSFHRDYYMDCRTGRVLGHNNPANPHAAFPHINMVDEALNECAISITSTSNKSYQFTIHCRELLSRCQETLAAGGNVRSVFYLPTTANPCPRANLVANIPDVTEKTELLDLYDQYCQ